MYQLLNSYKLTLLELKHWKDEFKKAKKPKRRESIQQLIDILEKRLEVLYNKLHPFIMSQPPMLRLIIEEVYLNEKELTSAVYENVKINAMGQEVIFKNCEEIAYFDETQEYDGDDDKPYRRAYENYSKRIPRACYKWDLKNLSEMDKIYKL